MNRSLSVNTNQAQDTDFGTLDHETQKYSRILSRGDYTLSDPARAARLANLLVNKGVHNWSHREYEIYLHAAYTNKKHDLIFNFNHQFLYGTTRIGNYLTQYQMYCYEEDFIKNHISRLALPDLKVNFKSTTDNFRYILLTACDDRYFTKYLASVVESFNSKEIHLHVAILDASQGTLDFIKHNVVQSQCLSFSYNKSSEYLVLTSHDHISAREQLLTIYACHRFFVAREILLKFPDKHLMVVDSDTDFINSDFLSAFNTLRNLELVVGYFRWENDLYPGTAYLANMLLFSPNSNAQSVIELLCYYISFFIRSNLGYWTLDQVALNAVDHYLRKNQQGSLTNISETSERALSLIKHLGSHEFRNKISETHDGFINEAGHYCKNEIQGPKMIQTLRDYKSVYPHNFDSKGIPFGQSLAPKPLAFHIFQDNSKQVHVLDLGFGAGGFASMIKTSHQTAHWVIDGIDGFLPNCINPRLLNERMYRNVWHANVMDIDSSLIAKYDLVCLLDVIEHLDIESAKFTLRLILNSLRDDAFLFVSTPLFFMPQESFQDGDLKEHLSCVPATSMVGLEPVLVCLNDPLVAGFVLTKDSLKNIALFNPISNKDFTYEKGKRILERCGIPYIPLRVFRY